MIHFGSVQDENTEGLLDSGVVINVNTSNKVITVTLFKILFKVLPVLACL